MKKKRTIRFKISPKKGYTSNLQESLTAIAGQFSHAAQYLTPLIKKDAMPPNEAVVLIAMYADAMIAGKTKDHTMTEKEIRDTVNVLFELWKQGLFNPGPEYPYTLEQTLEAGSEDEL